MTKRKIQSISSGEQRRKIPVVTVESFYEAHGEKLQLKLEGKQVGFHRKIREPTINRPGLALSGFYSYFAEKRIQVLGAAEQSYLKRFRQKMRIERFRALVRAENSVFGHVRVGLISIPSCWRWRRRLRWQCFAPRW